MASACVNNVGVTPGKFSSYGWLSPRVSFSRDSDAKSSKGKGDVAVKEKEREKSDLENDDAVDFEFCLESPVSMLSADELICEGKLMPMMQVSVAKGPEMVKTRRVSEVLSGGGDPYLFSPKAPRCASRWKEILGLKKLQQNSSVVNGRRDDEVTKSSSNSKSLKTFLHRTSKSLSSDSTGVNRPLLRDSESESVSMSSRLSLSSSSSGHELEDFPRLSLDAAADKHHLKPISLFKTVANSNPNNPNPPRVRLVKSRPGDNAGSRVGRSPMRRTATDPAVASALGISIDSPRMNSSGKIVFQSLERSSSSPGSFNGGPRFKHGGMERSYSANVRVSPVLNVPVCSLSKSGSVFGFGQLFGSPQKRDSNGGGNSRSYQCINSNSSNFRNRSDRA